MKIEMRQRRERKKRMEPKRNRKKKLNETKKTELTTHNTFSKSFSYLLNQSLEHYMDNRIDFGQVSLLVGNRIHSLLPNDLPTFEPPRKAFENVG